MSETWKSCPYRMSISRHVKVCNRIKLFKETECTIFGKSFMYPSYLNRHLESHEKKGDKLVPLFLTSFSTNNNSSNDITQLFPSTGLYSCDQTRSSASTNNERSFDISIISQYVPVPEICNSSASEENQLTTSHPLNFLIAHDRKHLHK